MCVRLPCLLTKYAENRIHIFFGITAFLITIAIAPHPKFCGVDWIGCRSSTAGFRTAMIFYGRQQWQKIFCDYLI